MPRPPTLRESFNGILIGFIVYVVLRIADGLIGNSAYNFASWAMSQVKQSITTNTWPWIVTFIIFLVCLSETIILWNQRKILNNALDTTNNMVDLDDSLLRLLVSFISTQDLEMQLRRLLEDLLRNAVQTLPGQNGRASVLLPESLDPNEEYLYIRASYMMPIESINRDKFYIGSDENKKLERGTAGLTYLDHLMRIGHINDHCQCDDKDFINFDKNRINLPYRSFVNVPIIGPPKGNAIICLGVLSFDSPKLKTFDSPQVQKLLLAFGRRTASILSIYIQLLQAHNQSNP